MTDRSDTPDFTPYAGPAGGWGSLRSVAEILPREGNRRRRRRASWSARTRPTASPASRCAWAKPANAHPAEFCENGAKATAWELTSHRADAGLLHRPPRRRPAPVARLRPGGARPADDAAALPRGDRPLSADRVGDGVRRDRRRTADARSQIGRVLRQRPREPRDQLHVRAVRPPVRHAEPARQQQHVPRDDVGGAEEPDRRAGRHGQAGGFRPLRRDLLLRPEHRLEQPAPAPPAAQRGPSGVRASSPSTRSSNAGWSASPIRRTRWRWRPAARRGSASNIIRSAPAATSPC